MGITGVELRHLFDEFYDSPTNRLWCALFHCEYDGELVIQEEEVDSMYLKSDTEILSEVEQGIQYCPDSMMLFKKYLSMNENKSN